MEEALKKVYAEFILNTAKEAAARVMVSESKALRIHHDLQNTKDEAVRMLVRFKRMMDVKTTEAESTALSQQKRIKELDEHLNETEGVIMDLRAEIRKAHERLEVMKNSDMQQSDQPSKNEHTHQEHTNVNPAKEITKSDPDLASIIIGHKEPELYRNGYTHRIHALDTNMVDEKKISEEKELIINMDETNRAPNKDAKNINGSESNHKLSRFCHVKLNLKKKSCGNDAKLTENDENNACALRRSVRKRKPRCWDEISSLFKSRNSLSHCKDNNGMKFEETKDNETRKKHESAAKESVGTARDGDNNGRLKYTFSRRQKKACSSISLTGQMREKPSYNLENEKSTPIDDSYSDKQNILDVACQVSFSLPKLFPMLYASSFKV
ncbi:uncharacterized protein LOC143628687 [Bidens hawaiensis]|uniref:uncharacterized protein LOC143628687 n=1 Tax=Bidens hawaiensis TaxID=980011 RepID=UPI004049ED1A